MVTSSDAPHVDARDPADAPRSTPTSSFELRAGPYAPFALTVLSLRGREAVSRQFSFEIVVAASPEVVTAHVG